MTPRPATVAGQGWAAAALLAVVVVAGSVSFHAVFTPLGVTVLAAAVAVLGVAVTRGAAAVPPARWAVAAAVGVAALAQLAKPPTMNLEGGTWLLPAGVVAALLGTAAAAVLLLPAVAGGLRRRRVVAGAALAAFAGAGLLVVRGSPRPLIDVWAILQGATLAAAHGGNPYDMTFTGVPPGQVDDCFNYLPATFLVPVASRLLLGDVRYAQLLVLVAGVAALLWWAGRSARGSVAPALAVLAGVLPGVLYDVQQAWNETVLVGALVGAGVALAARRPAWAVAGLALALATKQHTVLLLPLWALWPAFGTRRTVIAGGLAGAVVLPWLLADPSRFWHCTVGFFLDLPARPDSLSLWRLLPGPLGAVTLLTGVGVAYVLVLRTVPRTPGGLLVASGLVLAVFALLNKQSFLNQWLMAAQLVVAGLALVATEVPAPVRSAAGPRSPTGPEASALRADQ